MTARTPRRIGLLHYSAPPVIGGVENVMLAHVQCLLDFGYHPIIIAGTGSPDAFPAGTEMILLAEMDSQHPEILKLSRELEEGRLPEGFSEMAGKLAQDLDPVLRGLDALVVHNVLSKHFNLPLTAAIFQLLEEGRLARCINWCHDLTWTSPNSRSKVFPGYPWDLLRIHHPGLTYVTISQERQRELAGLLECPPETIRVVYNGVNAKELLALSDTGLDLIERLGLWESDLNLLMPVRVTQAKNVELAMHVAAALKQRGVHAKIVISGPPDPHDQQSMDYFHSLQSLRAALDVREHVEFIYEAGPHPDEGLTVDMAVVADLFRVNDALFMPSHREGFGMPILEAGLAGLQVFSSERVPAAREIGEEHVIHFSPQDTPAHVADLIIQWMERSQTLPLRRRVRRELTWRGIFRRQIEPLLQEAAR